MADRIQHRRDTAANWALYNPILLDGEVGIEKDTDQWKMGDGIHTWSQLPYRGGECLQQPGQSTTAPMSQKATTDLFNSQLSVEENLVGNDLDISDQQGNAVVGFKDGHIRTKSFDSKAVVNKLNTVEEGAEVNDVGSDNLSLGDLDISDEQGNVALRLKNGHIKTKNFDSSNPDISVDNLGKGDLDLSDNNGNVVARFKNGHIKTKNFDSSNIDVTLPARLHYEDKPSTVTYPFSVHVNCIIPDLENSLQPQDSVLDGIDYGYIALPSNYTAKGEPVRLIIYCHGAGTTQAAYQNPNQNFSDHYSCWTKLGFAFMDMYAAPSAFTGSTTELHMGNPIVLQCYKKGYEYVQRHFNIKRDGIFVIGASMGGLSSLQICMSGMFPVIGYVGYCPVCDLYKQAYIFQWNDGNRGRLAEFFKFNGRDQVTFTSGKPGTEAERTLFKDNIELWRGYNPILMHANQSVVQDILSYVPSVDDQEAWNAEENQEEAARYANLAISFPCPAKVFHCVNDNSVLFRYSKYLVEAIRRGGGLAWFRPLPSGGHSAWAWGDNVTVQDIDGNNFTMKASTYEAYLFLDRLTNNH